MRNVDKVIETFIDGDYFFIFIVLTVIILLVLVIALIKSRGDYNALLSMEGYKKKDIVEDFSFVNKPLDNNENDTSGDLLGELSSLMANNKEDTFDDNVPLVKQIDIPNIKTYDDIIDEYESSEEENAVISSEELERKTRERMETLGMNDNQVAIQKYEEEQEKKAIISYEQLLKNASNITLSYKEENNIEKDAPKVNKIEIEQKEVTGAVSYLEEEEFLKILKEFRTTL